MKNETLKRSQVRKIAKQYGFTIDDYLPGTAAKKASTPFSAKEISSGTKRTGSESEEHAHKYFKWWSEDERCKSK